MKRNKNIIRKINRDEHIKIAKEAKNIGDNQTALKHYQQSISITYEMIINLQKELIKKNINFIVAPYESDAQLAYLSINNFIDIVITEDSDLIPYQCKIIIFKLDNNGNGIEFINENIQNLE
jgi:exonuclease-1